MKHKRRRLYLKISLFIVIFVEQYNNLLNNMTVAFNNTTVAYNNTTVALMSPIH